MSFDPAAIRREFPITEVVIEAAGNGGPRPLIYLDHAASTHPCRRVIAGYTDFLAHQYANIHRGLHRLSMISTELFDRVSEVIAGYIGADLRTHCIVYTQNTTAALDLAAHVMADVPGITLTTEMEHHSNDLPHRQRGAVKHVRVTADGRLDLAHLDQLLAQNRVKLVAVTGASNVTGWMPDIHAIAARAHAAGARILVDAAQLLAHHPIRVGETTDPGHLDFVAAAGHKAYAPFGAAFLCGPRELFDAAPPYQPGGGTVACVTNERVYWLPAPDRHHGGTPNIPGVIAMASALEFLTEVGMPAIRAHEVELFQYALARLRAIDGLTLYGPPQVDERLAVLSFNLNGIPHGVVSAVLNAEAGIATRNGRFCAHPYVHRLLGIEAAEAEAIVARQLAGDRVELPGAVRASIGIYNTQDEIDRLAETLIRVRDGRFTGRYDAAALSLCNPDLADLRFEA
jgi:selenocysteine lyase/cysteine desulfurase